MKNFRETAQERQSDKKHPDQKARTALLDARFSTQHRNDFFDSAYADIMYDYFEAWLTTEPHEIKSREFLYSCMLGLGDVKARLIKYETYGKNVPHLQEGNPHDSTK